MASGIAHDINNAISPISLYTEALLEREQTQRQGARLPHAPSSGPSTTWRRPWAACASSTGRARTELQLGDVDLNPLVQQVVDLTRARWNDLAQQRGVMIESNT